MTINKTYYPDEISKALYYLCEGEDPTELDASEYAQVENGINDVEEILYRLMAEAENEYNDDSFRTFWNVMQKITERYDYRQI